jgi:hypothetical protein
MPDARDHPVRATAGGRGYRAGGGYQQELQERAGSTGLRVRAFDVADRCAYAKTKDLKR